MRLAVTGGTGFVGARLLDAALADGHPVRALARRPMERRAGIEWIGGALDQPRTLAELVAGTEAVIHVAGVISARTAAEFDRCNVGGTQAMLWRGWD